MRPAGILGLATLMTKLATIALLLAATTLTACGGTGSDQATSGDGSAAEGFPVAISQALGEVTIEDRPQRVVALDFPSADAAIAMGVVPVGMYEVSYVDGGVQEWTQRALGGERPEPIDTLRGFPFETIARLNPDVILATNAFPLISESWEDLNAIAPVVGHVEAPGVDTWQQGVRQVGEALGRAERAEQLITETEDEVAQTRRNHPEFEGRTLSFFNYVSGDGLYVINDESDVSIKFFRELGFAGITDTVAGLPGTDGRAQVSAERYDVLDADVVVGTSPDVSSLDEVTGNPVFARVPAVARGSYISIGLGPASALAFPSVLSIPYGLEQLVPELQTALDRRPS